MEKRTVLTLDERIAQLKDEIADCWRLYDEGKEEKQRDYLLLSKQRQFTSPTRRTTFSPATATATATATANKSR
jgi:hypothetical protein